MTSCSEWTGVPLSVLLDECGLQQEASWLVSEGADPGKFSHTLPLAKAMEDVIVAYGQNGEPVRVEQGYPIRLIVPGWEAPFSVKYLSHIKVVDQPYHAWNEAMNHSIVRADLGGKSRWYHFQFGPKVGDHAAFSRTANSRQGICPDHRFGLVRRRHRQEGRCIHRRRQNLEGSKASVTDPSTGAYPVYF
jgi:DMSO/TMAO reductase YedYZ molybdopterin-dependent catalytic subunit